MNLDYSLIAGVLENRDLSRAIRAGACAELLTDEAVTMWNLLVDYEGRFNEVPSPELFKELYPPYDHAAPADSIEAVIHELKTRRLGNDIQQGVRDLLELNAADPWKAKELFTQRADEISTRNQVANTRMVLGANAEATLAMLDSLAQHGGVLGLPWPWPYLNERTMGMRGGNLIYLYGREKSKKTYLDLYIALYLWSRGNKVLYFTREMTKEEISFIAYAILARLDIDQYKSGVLSTDQRENLETAMQLLRESGRFVISDNDGGIAGFKAEIEEVNPQVVVHDCWKYMADDAMGTKYGDEAKYVSRTIDQVKQVAIKRAIPVIVTGHANRGGEESKGRSGTEHAWSDNIIRRCDIALRVISNDAMDWLAIVINRARSMKQGGGFTISGQLCKTFGDFLEPNVSWLDDFSEAAREEEASKARAKPTQPQPVGVPPKFSVKTFGAAPDFKRQ